jgi:transcriptional regulator with XRE-family HTH domain
MKVNIYEIIYEGDKSTVFSLPASGDLKAQLKTVETRMQKLVTAGKLPKIKSINVSTEPLDIEKNKHYCISCKSADSVINLEGIVMSGLSPEAEFPERLVYFREKKGLSQAEFGKKLGMTTQTVQKWEKGTTFPALVLLEDIARLLGVSQAQLFPQTIPAPAPAPEAAKEKEASEGEFDETGDTATVEKEEVDALYDIFSGNKIDDDILGELPF